MIGSALTKTGKCLLYMIAALVIIAAMLAAFVRIAVLYGDEYRHQLASMVGGFIGSPVEISEIDLLWNRFDASASLTDVRILSEDRQETVLVLPSLEVQLNVGDMLMQRNLSVRSVKLRGLSLVASYEGHGQISIQGYEISRPSGIVRSNSATANAESGSDTDTGEVATASKASPANLVTGRGASALNWLFNANRIAILDSAITVIDRRRKGGLEEAYNVDDVNIRAFNDGDLHQIRISRKLIGSDTEQNIASFDFTGVASDINGWKGQFSIDTDSFELSTITEASPWSVNRLDGLAKVQVWGSWQGTRVNDVRLLLSGDGVQVTAADGSEAQVITTIDSVNVDLDWNRARDGWDATFNRFSLNNIAANRSLRQSAPEGTANDTADSADFGVTATSNDSDAVDDNTVVAGEHFATVDLSGLSLHSARRESGPREWRAAGPDLSIAQLRSLFPLIGALYPVNMNVESLESGQIKDWLVAAERSSTGQPRLYALKARVDKLVNRATGRVPGFKDLTADVYYREGKGDISFVRQIVSVDLPRLFNTPLPSLELQGSVQFEQQSDQLAFSSESLKLGTLDLSTDSAFTFALRHDGSMPLALNSGIDHANLAKLSDYYPEKAIKPKLYRWLRRAIVDGDVVRGSVSIDGDLKNFAPHKGAGSMFVEADVVDSEVEFRTDWPAAMAMDGNVTFDGTSLRGRVYEGSMREAQFSDARLLIANVRKPVAQVTTNAIGPLDDMLDFLQTGPLRKRLSGVVDGATGDGVSRLSIDVDVPLSPAAEKPLRVDGTVHLKNAQVNSNRFGLDFESVSGKVNFNRSGVNIDDLWVRYLGVPVRVKAVQRKRGKGLLNRVTVRGPIAVSSVMRSYGIPLAESFEGLSDWKVDLDIYRRSATAKPEIKLTAVSDLSGTAIKLPTPLRKPSDTLLQAELTRDFSKRENDWWFSIPGLIESRVRTGKDEKLESMAISLGNSGHTVLPWQGIALHGETGRLDALGWVDFALNLQKTKTTRKDPGAFPLFAKLGVRDLLVGSKDLGQAVYIAYRDGNQQIHRLESRYASGEMVLGDDAFTDDTLVFRLDNLDRTMLTAIGSANDDAAEVGESLPLDPRELPPFDISIKQLKWDNWRLSRVGVRTEPAENGMTIKALTARQQSMRLSGNGFWRVNNPADPTQQSTTVDLTATFDDIGQAIEALGGGRSFGEGDGEVAVALEWQAPAYQPDLELLTGQLLMTWRNGRILTVEPGAGRILGLFALQSLPRRLTLDFRDIVDTGLEYSSLSGSFSIADGRASTRGLVLTGPVAEVLIQGETDFVDQQYDQTIDVLPRVSGALPLLGVLSGGPAVGVTAIVADSILKGLGVNVDEIGRRRFTFSGPWDAPNWEPVDLRTELAQ
jgi:uncharacterized protein (TIGR02099 family)